MARAPCSSYSIWAKIAKRLRLGVKRHPTIDAPRTAGDDAFGQQSETGLRLLRNPDLRWLWIGQAVSHIGEGLNKVALLYLVYALTNSTLKMTAIGVLQTLPPLLFGPFLGVYVDRFPKNGS